jgi:hypothetical protein
VGRTPWSAADPLVGSSGYAAASSFAKEERDEGVRAQRAPDQGVRPTNYAESTRSEDYVALAKIGRPTFYDAECYGKNR